MCRGESARGDKRHFSVRYALLFFERETKTIIPGKENAWFTPGISADENYSENANNALSFLPKIRTECRRQNPLAVR